MAESYLIPAEETRIEMRVANSRFIATLAPVFSLDEARSFIERIKAEFADASHNVPAFVIGHGPAVTAHCNDDGEPAGTAGRPALAVLQGSELGDTAVVVTRYFGGTKLGAGGLVRAYGDAVRTVLARTPRARRVRTHTVRLVAPYPLFEQIRLLVENYEGQILDESFAAEVTVTARFIIDDLPHFQEALRELSHGALTAEIVEQDKHTIMPVK